jgi:hypothetical protein
MSTKRSDNVVHNLCWPIKYDTFFSNLYLEVVTYKAKILHLLGK